MCLYNNPYVVRELLASKEPYFAGWKTYYFNLHYNRIYPVFKNTYKAIDLDTTEIVSNSRRNKPVMFRTNLSRGIHVFRNPNDNWIGGIRLYSIDELKSQIAVDRYSSQFPIMVKVYGNKEDLIGASRNEMVFKRIFLSDQHWHILRGALGYE